MKSIRVGQEVYYKGEKKEVKNFIWSSDAVCDYRNCEESKLFISFTDGSNNDGTGFEYIEVTDGNKL